MLVTYEHEEAKWSLPSKSYEKVNPELKDDACDPSEDGGPRGGAQGDLPSRRVRKRTSFHQPCYKLKSKFVVMKIGVFEFFESVAIRYCQLFCRKS